jgi:hypothetical protein
MNMVFVCVSVEIRERHRKVGTERFTDSGKLNLLIKD